jgi:hypothetical protein
MLRIVSGSIIGLLLGAAILVVLLRLRSPQRSPEQEAPEGPAATEWKVDKAQFQPAPPKLIPGQSSTKPAITTDPRSPDYDVVKLSRLAVMSLDTAFDKEPRDALWAPAREQMLKETYERDLARIQATSRLLTAECKSATCQLVFAGKSLEDASGGSLLMQFTAAGNAVQPGKPYRKDGEVFLPVFVGYDAENRDPAAWTRNHAQLRKTHLDLWRSRPLPAGLPALPPN